MPHALAAALAAAALASLAPSALAQRASLDDAGGIEREIAIALGPANGRLYAPAPYPAGRVDSPSRLENGRLFFGRTAGEKIRESVLDLPGAMRNGAATPSRGDLVLVRTTDPLPPVAISPWQTIDESTFDELARERPWIRRSPERTDRLVNELRAAQNTWLRQHGYIQRVRTHVNPNRYRRVADAGDAAAPAGLPAPSAVIRVVPRDAEPGEPSERPGMRASVPPIRVSLPGRTTDGAAPIRVVSAD